MLKLQKAGYTHNVCMRNEYFIYNQFIKIKYKIILKENKTGTKTKQTKHCTGYSYGTNEINKTNKYSYVQCNPFPLIHPFFNDCTYVFPPCQNTDITLEQVALNQI